MPLAPPFLKPNDKVAIIATARKVSTNEMKAPIKLLNRWGLQVVTSPYLFDADNQFAGDDGVRTNALQWALDDKSIKAIFIARGGYGTIRLIDNIDFTKFAKKPKWIVGFSDITVLHSHIEKKLKIQTLHAPMPITFDRNKTSTNYLKQALFGELQSYQIENDCSLNRTGKATGKLVGGNLSLLYAMQGSKSDIKTNNKILFIEDLDEYLYHIDRMIISLKRSGKLAKLKGLVVGSMIDMKDNTIPFGKTPQQIILDAIKEYNYPVVFNFPSGHHTQNYPLKLGATIQLSVTESQCKIIFGK